MDNNNSENTITNPTSKLDGLRNPDGTVKQGAILNPTGKGGLQERPQDINIGGRKINIRRVSWWYDVFGRMNVEDLKLWNSNEPPEVILNDGEVIKKEWKSGYSEIAYNTFIRARISLKDVSEVTDRTEGKAQQNIKGDFTGNIGLDIPKEVKDAILSGFERTVREAESTDSK